MHSSKVTINTSIDSTDQEVNVITCGNQTDFK